MTNLDSIGVCVEDESYSFDATRDYDDYAAHAPSEFVARMREEREERERRDREELMELWREEQRARRRERAPLSASTRRWIHKVNKQEEE